MSKTSQKIQSYKSYAKEMRASGYSDGYYNRGFAWRCHPMLKHYRGGFIQGKKDSSKPAIKISFIKRLIERFK